MLRSVGITAEVAGTAQGNLLHNLRWQRGLELSLGCFLCERTDRTTIFEWGSPAAICTAEPEDGRHRTLRGPGHRMCHQSRAAVAASRRRLLVVAVH